MHVSRWDYFRDRVERFGHYAPSREKETMNFAFSNCTLNLADGTRWNIHAGDAQAVRIVSRFGEVLQLPPGENSGPTLWVTVNDADSRKRPVSEDPAVAVPPGIRPPLQKCVLSPPTDHDMLTIQMMRLSLEIVRDAQSRGGLLLHGALAENGSTGVILTGPGQVGKTTASRRLPPPWHSLCDDAALLVPVEGEIYRAHPWPTWSRLYSDGPGGSWDVQRAVPLRAIFFLAQSPDNRVSHIDTGQAIAMLMESVQQVSRPMTRELNELEIHALHREQLAAAGRVTRAIPIYMLHISLNGNFWKEIERVTSDVIERPAPIPQRPAFTTAAPAFEKSPGHPVQRVMYTGPSMNHTCREPDLLEVIPYGDSPVRRGDIIYFRPPGSSYSVVHRVIRVTPGGIRTRGDNNTENDHYLVRPSDINGRVISAWRGRHLRRIAGGWRGYFIQYRVRLRRIIRKMIAKVLKKLYKRVAKAGIFRHLLLPGIRPHVVAFETKHQTYFKLMMGRRVVGRCDKRRGTWHIRFPFHLFVDESALPIRCLSKENAGKKAREWLNSMDKNLKDPDK